MADRQHADTVWRTLRELVVSEPKILVTPARRPGCALRGREPLEGDAVRVVSERAVV